MSPKKRTAKARKRKSTYKRKRAASRGRKSSVADVILKTVSESHEPKGVSVVALKKALAAGGYDVRRNNVRIKLTLRSLVKKGSLVQTKGHGVHRLFKVNTGHVVRKAAKRHGTRIKRAAPRKAAAKKRRAKRVHKKAKRPAAAGARKVRKSLRKGKKPAGKKVRKRLRKKRVKAVKHQAAKKAYARKK